MSARAALDAANFYFDHPLGPILGWFSGRGLQRLDLHLREQGKPKTHLLHGWKNNLRAVALEADFVRYFAGLAVPFDDVPLDLEGATEFQRAVWRAARAVPWGTTMSYGDLTARLDRKPGSARAVGAALGANPIAIVIPCHRFVGANGNLVNFAAGLPWKEELLRLEGALLG